MSKSVQCDPVAIQKLANWYCRRSVVVLVFYPVLAVLLFGYAFYALGGDEFGKGRAAVLGAGVGVLLGYLFGSLRSKTLQLQAQTVLCQQRIEENTRTA